MKLYGMLLCGICTRYASSSSGFVTDQEFQVLILRETNKSLIVELQSHHKPREGPFELNDVFAIINAVPAIALLAYGFFHKGLIPGLCFGAVS